jgi:hypothetical protein
MSVQGTIGFDLVWLDVYDTAKMREARKSYQELKGRLDSLTKMKKALTQYQSWLVQRQPATRK